MSLIGDWWYAIKVCKKYGITWNPFRDLSNASYYISWDCTGVLKKSSIHMSPFYPKFKETFLHEVGHHLLHRRGTTKKLYSAAQAHRLKFESKSVLYGGKLLLPLLVEESLASRFARKVMRGEADVNDLVKAFQTYAQIGYSGLLNVPESGDVKVRLTDFVEQGIRRIEK